MHRPALAPVRRPFPLLLQPAPSAVLRDRTAGPAALRRNGHLLRLAARRLLWPLPGWSLPLSGPSPLGGGGLAGDLPPPFPSPTRAPPPRGPGPPPGGPPPAARASPRNP